MTVLRFDISKLVSALRDGHTFLVPNHRSRDAICYTYAQQQALSQDAWLAPEVYAIDIWLMDQCERLADLGISPFLQTRILNKHEELALWQQVIESSTSIYPLINPIETAQAISRTYRLQQQWINPLGDKQLNSYAHIPDVAAYLQWAKRFRNHCQTHGTMVLADAILAFIKALSSPEVQLPEQLVLVNFFDPPPLYKELFGALTQHSNIVEIPGSAQSPVYSSPEAIQRMGFAELEEEIRACANWAKQVSQKHSDAHIAIVLKNLDENSDEKLLIENLFLDVFDSAIVPGADGQELPFNLLSQGAALTANQPISTALKILGLNHKKQSTGDFCQLISSPLLLGAAEESEARIRLETHYRRFSETTAKLADLRQPMLREEKDYHCPVLAKALLDFQLSFTRGKNSISALAWTEVFEEQLEIMGWSSPKQQVEDEKIWQQWLDCLLVFRQASDLLGKLTFSAAYNHLKLICSHTAQLNPFSPNCPISITSATEAVGLHYSHLWLLAADHQTWPGPTKPHPFLPASLQHQLAMPGSSSQWQLEHAKNTLAHLSHATSSELIISHHQLNGDQILYESPVIRHHALFGDVPVLIGSHQYTPPDTEPNIPLKLEQIIDCKPVPLRANEKVRGGSSLLTDQSNCPFKAFARHRLGANELAEFENGLDSRARGTALHTALQHLWRELGSHEALVQKTESELHHVIGQAIANAIAWLRRRYPETMTPAIVEIENQRLAKLLQDYLRSEHARSAFTVKATEKRSQLDFDKLSLALTVDRIDQLEDGSLVLIDYKTGKQTNFRWLDERPLDLQLPLYQMTIDKELEDSVEAVLISQINADHIRYVGESKHSDLHPDLSKRQRRQKFDGTWTELQEFWNGKICSLANEVEQGLCTVTPTSLIRSCQYCDLSRLCRINENISPAEPDQSEVDHDD